MSKKHSRDFLQNARDKAKEFEGEDNDLINEDENFDDFEEDNFDDDMGDDDLFTGDYGNDFIGDGGVPPMEKHKDLLKDLTNFSPYLKDTVNNWLGLIWDEEEGKYVRNQYVKPIMNMKGAMWCVGFLKTYTRENNIITDISADQYRFIVCDLIETIWFNLGTRDDLGIKEDGDLIRVATEMQHAAELALMGAGDGKYTKFLGTTYSHSTTGQLNPGGNPININQQPPIPQAKGIRGKIRKMLLGE